MQTGNYARHLKVLGKICYLYDTAASEVTALELTTSRLFDQVATGESVSLPGVKLLAPFVSTISRAVDAGASTLKTIATNMASAYLTSADFRGDLDTTPTSTSSPAAVLDALIADMTSDSKTFTTQASTGLVNFFVAVFAPGGTFPQSGSPTHADSTYVVQAIV
jgi:hypothetical protein